MKDPIHSTAMRPLVETNVWSNTKQFLRTLFECCARHAIYSNTKHGFNHEKIATLFNGPLNYNDNLWQVSSLNQTTCRPTTAFHRNKRHTVRINLFLNLCSAGTHVHKLMLGYFIQMRLAVLWNLTVCSDFNILA